MTENLKLPEGWKRVRLGEIGEIVMGQSPTSSLINKEGRGVPFLQGNAEFGKKYPRPINWATKPLKIANPESILISVRAPVGALNISDRYYCIGRGLASIILKNAYLIYIWHLLRFNMKKLMSMSQGSTFEAIGKNDLHNLILSLPPLPEQQKIAEILETIDNAIEKTDKIIEKYKRIKRGLMQDLLTKGIDENGRIRSEETHKFKDSPLGRIPEEWEVVRLGEISKVKRGASPRPIDDQIYFTEEGEGRAWIRIEDVARSNKYLKNTRQYLSKYGEEKSIKVDPYEVIMSICATIGKPIIVEVPSCIHDGFVVFKNLSSNVKEEYLYYFISFKEDDISKLGQTGTQGNLNSIIVSNILIPLPPFPEQQRIASILSQIDQVIEKEEAYRQKLEKIKKGLMEDLLTGKVRVNKLIEEAVH